MQCMTQIHDLYEETNTQGMITCLLNPKLAYTNAMFTDGYVIELKLLISDYLNKSKVRLEGINLLVYMKGNQLGY